MIWNRRNKKAFTLIELLVVIAIIGILGSIVAVSTIAIMRNSEQKSMETMLRNYWRLTATYFDQVNKHLSTDQVPDRNAIAARLNLDYKTIQLKTSATKSLSKNYLFIQYSDNPKSQIARFSIVKMIYRYKDTYYKMDDGQNMTYSSSVTS